MIGERGYTIVEVMIFLAVSGVLFASAMILIGGRQSSLQFTQSMRDIDSRVQDVVNDVSTGFFPTVKNLGCSRPAVGSTLDLVSNNLTHTDISQNDECILLGKVIHFSPNGEGTKFNIYSVVGSRTTGTAQYSGGEFEQFAENLSEAFPTIVYQPTNGVDLTEYDQLQWGVQLKSVINGSSMFGVYSSLTGSDLTGYEDPNDVVFKRLKSGSQVAQAVDFRSRGAFTTGAASSSPWTSISQAGTVISDEAQKGYGLVDSYVLCFENGDGGRTATLTLSQNGRAISTKLEFTNC